MNVLLCSAGRRCELIKLIKRSLGEKSKIVATDLSPYAPALYFADKQYLVPEITDEKYIDRLVDICDKEKIQAIITLIDPEIAVLSENRKVFEEKGIIVFVPYEKTARICFDKFELYRHFVSRSIPTVLTYGSYEAFLAGYQAREIAFPVFVKPRTGSGSVGAKRIDDPEQLKMEMQKDPSLIIQEYIDGGDMDADVFVDAVSRKVVSVFAKKKLSTTIGGANKTVSFKDEKLFDLIGRAADTLELYGPNDIDIFYRNGEYCISEINPRFGGAYLHAFGAGVDFFEMMENNIRGLSNTPRIGAYEEGVVMMMYDSVVIKKEKDLLRQ